MLRQDFQLCWGKWAHAQTPESREDQRSDPRERWKSSLASATLGNFIVTYSQVCLTVSGHPTIKVAPYIFNILEPLSFNGVIETLCITQCQ